MRLNPGMLTLAREYRELTQEELSIRAQITQSRVAQIENNLIPDVTDEVAERLAMALEVPSDFFTQDEELVGFGSSAYVYRKKADLTARDRKRIHATVNLIRIHLKKMLLGIELRSKKKLPTLSLEDYKDSPTRVAQAVRAFWQLPDGPIDNITTVIENAGVIIIPVNFKTRSMDATSLWLNNMPPLIFINDALPGDRWRFTLAHELGHLVMHTVPHERMEDEANEFAAEFLMPELEMRPIFRRIGKLSLEQLAKQKLVWKTAMAAILKRADDLGFLNPHQKRYLWIAMKDIRMEEPHRIPREEPRTYRKVVDYYITTLGFTLENMNKILRVFTRDLLQLHAFAFSSAHGQPRFSVVS